jgi:hypothetical protein
MSASSKFYDILIANASLMSLAVGGVHKFVIPSEKPLPAIAYERASTEYENLVHGDPPSSEVQFNLVCVSSTPAAAEDMGDAIERIVDLTMISRIDQYEDGYDPPFYSCFMTVQMQRLPDE